MVGLDIGQKGVHATDKHLACMRSSPGQHEVGGPCNAAASCFRHTKRSRASLSTVGRRSRRHTQSTLILSDDGHFAQPAAQRNAHHTPLRGASNVRLSCHRCSSARVLGLWQTPQVHGERNAVSILQSDMREQTGLEPVAVRAQHVRSDGANCLWRILLRTTRYVSMFVRPASSRLMKPPFT